METGSQGSVATAASPAESDVLEAKIVAMVAELLLWIRTAADRWTLLHCEQSLLPRMWQLFGLLAAFFLALRHERFDLRPHLAQGWRVKSSCLKRKIKTLGGVVAYGRAYLVKPRCPGWCPLDAALGITGDGFSWRVIDLATRLATRMSYAGVQQCLKNVLGWAPSTESIEKLVIGLGSRAAAFMETQGPLPGDGEVLVIEADGKAAPMATDAELAARRGKRQPADCGCGGVCARHRRRARRRERPRKQRKTRGHNSKNGRSATLVAMYTLRRGADGLLHGPINKKVWGQFGTRREMLLWARQQATRRGFGPDTESAVQIVVDGERCLRENLREQFPRATLTLDLRHAQERLWKAGRAFHAENSPELSAWVEPLGALLVAGRVADLLAELRRRQAAVPLRGPNTKAKRDVLQKQIHYYEERRDMMRYDEYRDKDLVLATGVIEGACRHVIGERLDCAGMRWTLRGAQPLLQLRCIELNGDWDAFIDAATRHYTRLLHDAQPAQVRIPPSTAPPKAARRAA